MIRSYQDLGGVSSMINAFSSNLNTESWLYAPVMSRTRFRVNPHSIVALLEAAAKSEV